MEKQEELRKIVSEIEKDFIYLDKALDKKQRNQFEERRIQMIDKLKKIEEDLK